MAWLKVKNNKLVPPPKYDTVTGLSNCHLDETWLIEHRIH